MRDATPRSEIDARVGESFSAVAVSSLDQCPDYRPEIICVVGVRGIVVESRGDFFSIVKTTFSTPQTRRTYDQARREYVPSGANPATSDEGVKIIASGYKLILPTSPLNGDPYYDRCDTRTHVSFDEALFFASTAPRRELDSVFSWLQTLFPPPKSPP